MLIGFCKRLQPWSGAWEMKLFCAALFWLLAVLPAAHASDDRIFTIGHWEGFRFSEDGAFSHCAAMTLPNGRDALVLAIGRGGELAISIASDRWKLKEGTTLMATLSVDGQSLADQLWANDKRSLLIRYETEDQAINAYEVLSRGRVLSVRTPAGSATFGLTDASPVLDALVQCVEEAVAAEQPAGHAGTATASRAVRVERAELMAYVVNLLSEAGMTGHTFLAPSEFQEALPDYDVVWRNADGTVGAATMFTNAARSDLDLASANTVAMDAARCPGDFVSGVRKSEQTETAFIKEVFTRCGADGAAEEAYYVMSVTNEGVLLATATIALDAGDAEDVERTGAAIGRGIEESF
jgi:hypothetical protein